MKLASFLTSRWLSTGLIVLGVMMIGLSYYQQISQELWYWWKTREGTQITVDASPSSSGKKVVAITPKSMDYGIVVEKLGVNESVAANINPFNAREYLPVLEKIPVAEAAGGAMPGQAGTVYLFGHSTVNLWEIGRYKAPFTLLHKLEANDRIVIFYKGQRYDYIVQDKRVVSPSDVEVLTAKREKPTLILQTCDPPGENTKRLLVFAELGQSKTGR